LHAKIHEALQKLLNDYIYIGYLEEKVSKDSAMLREYLAFVNI